MHRGTRIEYRQYRQLEAKTFHHSTSKRQKVADLPDFRSNNLVSEDNSTHTQRTPFLVPEKKTKATQRNTLLRLHTRKCSSIKYDRYEYMPYQHPCGFVSLADCGK